MRFGRINLLCCLLIHISGLRPGSGQITWIRRYVFVVDLKHSFSLIHGDCLRF